MGKQFYKIINTTIILLVLAGCEKSTGWLTPSQADQEIENIISQIQEPTIPDRTINIIEFSGLKPDADGSIDFHPYIQPAIDSLEKMGGGWLHFAHTDGITHWLRYTKTYQVKGSINLKSNTGLLIDRSVRLFFPFDPVSYLNDGEGVLNRYEGTTIFSFAPLIRSFNQKNIAIKSNGTTGALPVIDGDGEKWQRWMWEGEMNREVRGLKHSYQLLKDVNNADVPIRERVYTDPENDFFRPETMQFYLCQNVLVDGIKIRNSPFWCVSLVFSQSAIFRNMEFDAYNVNNDGIDPESSRNVLIENIVFGNHDDNVALKAGRDKEGRDGALVEGTILENIESEYIRNGRITGPTKNIVIRNNHFSGHYAVCIGSEMSGSVRNVYAVDNVSVGSVNMGVFLKSSRLRGGIIEDVYVRGLHLNHVKNEVIAMIPNYDKADDKPFPPEFRNIHIEDVSCNSAGRGVFIHGWADKPVRDVFLKNISLKGIEDEKYLQVKQVLNVVLRNVILNGRKYNKEVSSLEEEVAPPVVI